MAERRDPRLVYQAIVDDGLTPSVGILLAALKVCKNSRDLRTGAKIHGDVIKNRDFSSHAFVASALVDMYAKCGRLGDAKKVFEGMSSHDLVSWNCMIQGYAQSGEMDLALELYDRMRREGCDPNRVTLLAALKACATLIEDQQDDETKVGKATVKKTRLKCLERGRALHNQAVRTGNDLDPFVANTLVDMYAKCGSMEDARKVFDKMRQRDVVSWNCIVLGYAQNEQGEVALELFSRMQEEGFAPNSVTYLGALKACIGLSDKEQGMVVHGKVVKSRSLEQGRAIHLQARKSLRHIDLVVANALIDFYSSCGSLEEARRVFDGLQQRRDVVSWNSIIQGHAQGGEGVTALRLYRAMKDDGFQPNRVTVLAALKACASLAEESGSEIADQVSSTVIAKSAQLKRCHEKGREIHSEAEKLGYHSDVFVASTLIDMYAKCGSLKEACEVFENMKTRNVVPWTAIIMAYAQAEDGETALRLFSRMQEKGTAPNRVTILAALKACVSLAENESGNLVEGKLIKTLSLEKGRGIHQQAKEIGVDSELFVVNALIDMYSRCGSIIDASQVFSNAKVRDVVSWNSIIQGYAQGGEPEAALELYSRMQKEAKYCYPNRVTNLAALKACICLAEREDAKLVDGKMVKMESLKQVQVVHSQLPLSSELEIFVANTLINAYAKCGSMADARGVFDTMKQRSSVSWTATIMGYVESGAGEVALELYERMQTENQVPSAVTVLAALKACASLAEKEEAEFVNGKPIKVRSLQRGKDLHSQAAKLFYSGGQLDLFVANTLIDVYSKCGDLVEARKLFESLEGRKSTVSWNCMIQGYAQGDSGLLALELYDQMEDAMKNRVSYLAALKACATLGEKSSDGIKSKAYLDRGRAIHREAVENEARNSCDTVDREENMDVTLANTLIDMYAKCGSLEESRMIFEKLQPLRRTLVSWNCLILAYTEGGDEDEALKLFRAMRSEGRFEPDAVTYLAALKACASLAALEAGRKIYTELQSSKLLLLRDSNDDDAALMLSNSLISFFAKCGSMDEAEAVFRSISRKNVSSWSALIAGYSFQGDCGRALELFYRMEKEKFRPNEVTFLALLTACSHAGAVDEGELIFASMRQSYGIPASIQHYACMVDLLGRANKLDRALELAESMPMEADSVVWTALLAASRKWKNARIGRIALERALEREPGNAAAFVLMANLYARLGMWDEAAALQASRKRSGASKPPGRSWWTADDGAVHAFVAGDGRHPRIREIHAKVAEVVAGIKELGYVPVLESALVNGGDEEKESALCSHSERLAIACALIHTEAGRTVRIVKNLRVCDDCHEALGWISQLEQRRIVCRDAGRFHVFQDGMCSCGGFW